MGVHDSPLDILEKLQAWVSFSASDLPPFFFTGDFQMSNNCVRACCECGRNASDEFFIDWHCQSCDRWLCAECFGILFSNDAERAFDDGKKCKLCCTAVDLKLKHETGTLNREHYPSLGLQGRSPEAESPSNYESGRNDRLALYFTYSDCGYSPDAVTNGSVTTISALPSPVSVRSSSIRNDRDEAEFSRKLFYSPLSEYHSNISDIDSNSVCARLEFNSCKSEEVSQSDSPRSVFSSHKAGLSANLCEVGSPRTQLVSPFDKTSAVFKRLELEKGTEDLIHTTDNDKPTLPNADDKSLRELDFECNRFIWFIPPEYGRDDAGSNFFAYHDDDIGDSGTLLLQRSSVTSTFSLAEKQNEVHKEPLKVVIQGHFTALVAHLLQGELNKFTINESNAEWLDIISKVAWQAANYVKPDTSRGGSMDPTDYIKIKCIASGNPGDSIVVKGVVCTKNTKHKRMITQYKSPRLLLLAGALEYPSVANQLTSFNTLVQQENDHLKLFMSKIESFQPNVLLVEKSVSPNTQEYLLTKEISLVLNVKKPLLERIARCTGALVASAAADDFTAHLGSCELFHVERIFEEHEANNLPNKKNSKTLMFFDGCPRRLGCTVLLRGACREELKILKNIVQYAVFAAYHLSLETSFFADEGASLPKMAFKNSIDDASLSFHTNDGQPEANKCVQDDESVGLKFDHFPLKLLYANTRASKSSLSLASMDCYLENSLSSACLDELASSLPSDIEDGVIQEEQMLEDADNSMKSERMGKNEACDKYFQATDNFQSILVLFSRRCVVKGSVCERSRLLRIKFYGSFDKPLGRYLQDDLFDRTTCCRCCKEPSEDHVLCYTHKQGNLTINVRYLPSVKLPGKKVGKIWMWHRCLRCAPIDGVPPATRKVVMSDAAWGLSFGKFLELSFSNNATANRLAPCGHSLQRDCLRFYGYGSMVAFFCFSTINILNVHMPSPELDFNGHVQRERIEKEAAELLKKVKALYMEISDVLCVMEKKCVSYMSLVREGTCNSRMHSCILELKDGCKKESHEYNDILQSASMGSSGVAVHRMADILELGNLRRALLIGSWVWDHRLSLLDSLIKDNVSKHEAEESIACLLKLQEVLKTDSQMENNENVEFGELPHHHRDRGASNLSERIDSAWTGTAQAENKVEIRQTGFHSDGVQARTIGPTSINESSSSSQAVRVTSLGSVLNQEKFLKRPAVLDLPSSRSLQTLLLDAQNLSSIHNYMPSFISSMSSGIAGEARLLISQRSYNDMVIGVYDDDFSSIVACALNSKEYCDWVLSRGSGVSGGNMGVDEQCKEPGAVSACLSSGSAAELNQMHSGSYDNLLPSLSTVLVESKGSQHLTVSYGDESFLAGGKVKFSVVCYFVKQFDSLRRKCCPNEVDFLCSLSRCLRWSAQGGKSNVYFAKSLDERFIIKQVKKAELDSFLEFAPQYLKYLTDSLNSGSPTCLAKVLGIYQVTIKQQKGGKETKMDLMVMENLFFKRSISRVYDLKGSARSRYNPDTTGTNAVLLDMNLVEAICKEPMFLGSKTKRKLERAIWNDTYFLASVDVMDYSLLVGVDEEKKELILGIIDYMRQYTWDKHLETWVKASGILGGPKNTSPTVISPLQYKKRFRKAMSSYFLTVPDHWSS